MKLLQVLHLLLTAAALISLFVIYFDANAGPSPTRQGSFYADPAAHVISLSMAKDLTNNFRTKIKGNFSDSAYRLLHTAGTVFTYAEMKYFMASVDLSAKKLGFDTDRINRLKVYVCPGIYSSNTINLQNQQVGGRLNNLFIVPKYDNDSMFNASGIIKYNNESDLLVAFNWGSLEP